MTEILIGSSVLILALLFLRAAFRPYLSRRTQYALWGLVLARLLVPASFPAAALNLPSAARIVRSAAVQQAEFRKTPVSRAGAVPATMDAAGADAGQKAQKRDSTREAPPGRADKTPAVWTGVWAAGMLIAGSYFLAVNAKFYVFLRKRRRPWPVDGHKNHLWLVEEGLPSPCLFGRSIYLTPAAVASPDRLRHVLAHEETHARHLDSLWSLLRCVCLTVYWFDPLVWVAAECSKTDCELACDEGTLSRFDDSDRIPYGRTLLSLIPVKKNSGNLFFTAATMGKRQLRERMNCIARRPRQFLPVSVPVVILAALLAACSFAAEKEPGPVQSLGNGAFPAVPGDLSSWNGRNLTGAEIERVNKAFEQITTIQTEQGEIMIANPANGFFASYYADVRDLDLGEFIAYYPSEVNDTKVDEAEFQALRKNPDFIFGEAETLEDMPLPVHRHRRSRVDETLKQYAGITTADLTDTRNMLYMPEYDAWYNFTSDFGAGYFNCAGGIVIEESYAVLQGNFREDGSCDQLVLLKEENNWHIKSFLHVSAPAS